MLFALISALLMALSQLTSWGWLALIGYLPLVYATRDSTPARAFKLFFFSTVLQYMATLYWLTIAMTVFGHLNWFVSGIALALLSALIGAYLGGAGALSRYISIHTPIPYWLVFAMSLCLTEYLRDYGFIGSFPWGSSGYSLISTPILMQSASIFGVYGLVFCIGLINSSLALRKFWVAGLILATMLVYGQWRLSSYDPTVLPKVKVALLQGNIEQGIKNQSALYGTDILERYRLLQNQAVAAGSELVIWPESSYPYRLSLEEPHFVPIGNLAPVNIISALSEDRQNQFYNSAYILNAQAEILGRFDKNHLVPFGEYVPWPFNSVAQKLVPNLGEFARGRQLEPVTANGIPLAITVCYEGVFPNISRNFVRKGATLLVNVTNDAWYGFSAGPYQHLGMYQMRSVETGRSFARATNTGVSAWVDPRGNLHQTTPLYEEDLVIAYVPLSSETTFYTKTGDFVPLACGIILLLALMLIRKPRSKTDWLLALLGLSVILASHVYFEPQKLDLQEAAFTKDTLFIIVGLLLGLRAWKLKV